MTISTTSNRKDYVATGGQTVFPYDFLILADSDLKVYQEGTLLTLTTHYTVSGAGSPSGGNVTLVTGATVSDEIVIIRDMAITQATDYVENDPFPAEVHEDTVDKLTMIVQQFNEQLGRAIKLAVTSTLSEIDIPLPGANKVIGWNAAGTALELKTITDSTISSPIAVRGDIIQGDSSGDPAKLAIGSEGQFIRPDSSGDLAYETLRLSGLVAESELTISSGNITPTAGIHSVDTESDASTDDLANILTTNLPDGSLLYIRANNTARTAVVKDAATGAGQIHLADSADLSLDDDLKWLLLQRRGADWYEVFRDVVGHNVAANVHGLGSSVNVLGNRDASAEFIQRGTLNPPDLGSGGSTIYIGGAFTVTFAVAFSTSPKVCPGGTKDNQIESAFCFNISTTGFSYRAYGTTASEANTDGEWVALGA